MIDAHGRKINYLRLSVTDRCNHRCFYCMDESANFLPEMDLLSFEEIKLLAKVFFHLGINKVRITGGEPLLRSDIVGIVKVLSERFTVAMTTNGSLLSELAKDLKEAGLSSVNVSLHSLKTDTFRKITRGDLDRVLRGIDEGLNAGLSLKLNAVVCDENFGELPKLVLFASERRIPIRFIELMPVGRENKSSYFEKQILEKLSNFRLTPTDVKLGEGPARYFVTADGNYVGLISAMSKSFCESCNKIRMSCDGKLYPCLGSSLFFDLRQYLMDVSSIEKIQDVIFDALKTKPLSHTMKSKAVSNKMNQLGG